jgi:hypothetical protein
MADRQSEEYTSDSESDSWSLSSVEKPQWEFSSLVDDIENNKEYSRALPYATHERC